MRPKFFYIDYWTNKSRWSMRMNYSKRILKKLSVPRIAIPAFRSLFRRIYHTFFHRAILLANSIIFFIYSNLKKTKKRPDKIRSVLHLSVISHKPFMLSRIMRKNGIRSSFLALNCDGSYLDIGYDWGIPTNVNPLKRKWLEFYYTWAVMVKYDVIHCHFNATLSHLGTELELMKKLGKLVVFHYRGCDARYRSRNEKLHPMLNCCTECNYPIGSCDTPAHHERLALTHKFGNLFFVTTPDLLEFAPTSAIHIPFIKPNIPINDIPNIPRDPDIFRVVTSSNHHGIDGTPYIEKAVERLKNEGYKIELIIVEKKPYLEALGIYKSADVYAGKLRMGYYNNANIETLMLGVPNMSYIRDEFKNSIPDSPIINSNIYNIYDNLKAYIDKRDDLKAIGEKGPSFVEKYHSHDSVASTLIDQYNEAFKNLTAD